MLLPLIKHIDLVLKIFSILQVLVVMPLERLPIPVAPEDPEVPVEQEEEEESSGGRYMFKLDHDVSDMHLHMYV